MEWARSEKRTFLRQRIEARLANLLLEQRDFSGALALISKLLAEVRSCQLLTSACTKTWFSVLGL